MKWSERVEKFSSDGSFSGQLARREEGIDVGAWEWAFFRCKSFMSVKPSSKKDPFHSIYLADIEWTLRNIRHRCFSISCVLIPRLLEYFRGRLRRWGLHSSLNHWHFLQNPWRAHVRKKFMRGAKNVLENDPSIYKSLEMEMARSSIKYFYKYPATWRRRVVHFSASYR